MPSASDKLHTPIYLKTGDDFAWPEDERAFYLLTRDGLFLCRNHPLFRSSVPVEHWPAELAAHQPRLTLNYPRIPRRLFEQVVGFFSIIARRHNAEAAALLAWDRTTGEIAVVVPEQVGVVSRGWYGSVYPLALHYQVPSLPARLLLIGDLHSHVDFAAYSSGVDRADEEFRPGLHIVVGRIQSEPPEFHCEVTVDGVRFRVGDFNTVIAGYQRRREREVPREWIEQVTVKMWAAANGTSSDRRTVALKPEPLDSASAPPADPQPPYP